MKQLYAPTGAKIVGTADIVQAVAGIEGWEEDGEPIYAGGSEVDWDSQRTRTVEGEGGKKTEIVVDENGEEWLKSDCELRDEADEGEDGDD